MLPLSETVLLFMGLLAIAMVAASFAGRIPIPFTVILVGIGMALGVASQQFEPLAVLQHLRLTPDMVLFIFLPALIFESGYNLDARQLIKDIVPILTLAVPALLLSATIIGSCLWLLFDMDFSLALLFGALISATDPVAVIALFKELGAPQRLTVLVEGESLLNDATAIVVFNILVGIVLAGGLETGALLGASTEFLYVFFGGALLGILFGLIFSEWMRLLRNVPSGILALSVILAYLIFIVAEHYLHVSGVMAVAAAALCLGVYGVTRIPQRAGEVLRETWEFIAFVCNALLFLLVGLSVDLQAMSEHLPYIAAAIALVLLARTPAIYALLPATIRLFRLPHIRRGDQHIMWWGGLKGGLAIAIVLAIPEEIPGKQLLLHMTLGVVVFTLLVNASTIRPLIHRLGLDQLTSQEQAELTQGLAHIQGQADHTLSQIRHAGLISKASFRSSSKKIKSALHGESHAVGEGQQLHYVYLVGMRAEMEELEQLRDAGTVPQYVLLDLKSELERDRELLCCEMDRLFKLEDEGDTPILRLEMALLRRLRERDWLVTSLAYYQMLRLSQRLRRNVLRILMSEAAVEHLQERSDLPAHARDTVLDVYKSRLGMLRRRVTIIRREFPEFFSRFEAWFGMQAALAAAQNQSDDDHEHGEISAKVHARIHQRIAEALGAVPRVGDAVPQLPAHDLLQMVPLFSSLPESVLKAIAEKATPITFLGDDVIIGEGEKGDALYIISRGCVQISRGASTSDSVIVAELREGDFFGEMALLGDQVRKATVHAMNAVTMLRLTRADVLALADKFPEVARQLHEAEAARKPAEE